MFQGEFRNIPQTSPWLLCAMGGILGGLALEPVGWFPLAWVALVPLLWTWRRSVSPRSGAIASFAWGVGFHGVGLWWLTGLHPLMWMGLNWWTSVGVALGCWLFVFYFWPPLGGAVGHRLGDGHRGLLASFRDEKINLGNAPGASFLGGDPVVRDGNLGELDAPMVDRPRVNPKPPLFALAALGAGVGAHRHCRHPGAD